MFDPHGHFAQFITRADSAEIRGWSNTPPDNSDGDGRWSHVENVSNRSCNGTRMEATCALRTTDTSRCRLHHVLKPETGCEFVGGTRCRPMQTSNGDANA